MIKLEMKLNNEMIVGDAKHTPNDVYAALDKVFSKYSFKKSTEKDGTLSYSGNGSSTDFGSFTNIVLFLKKKDWFMPYVEKWLWYNSDDGANEDDFAVEDILYHYAHRKSAI